MKKILLRCGKLFDGVHTELRPNMEILVSGSRIEAIGEQLRPDADTEIRDLSHLTVTPGMIDAHVHTTFFDWRNLERDNLSSSNWKTLASLYCAQQMLHRGFTTIRDVGTGVFTEGYNGFATIAAKRAIDAGYFEGARMVVAPTFLCTPGSHGDQSQHYAFNPVLSHFMQNQIPSLGNGADFFRGAVREQVKYGADFVKIMATGGFFTPNDSPVEQQLTDEELKAIIETAKEVGTTVTAHVYTSELVTKLAEYGIDGVEHASMIDKETARLVEEKNMYVVPTFSQYDDIIYMDEDALSQRQPAFRRKLEHYQKELIRGREVLKNSEIRLGYGTDFVAVHQNYEAGYEYCSWLNSGIDPFRALRAATSVNAGILGLSDIGEIAVGKRADIAGWDRDLLTDPNALLSCAYVMQDGREYEPVKCIK